MRHISVSYKGQFSWALFLDNVTASRYRLIGWPLDTVGMPPGRGFNSQSQLNSLWSFLETAIEQGHVEFVSWTPGVLLSYLLLLHD